MMLSAFLTTLEQMIRIVLLLALGYMLNRLHLIPKAAEQALSRLVTILFLPCLTLYTNAVNCDFHALVTYGQWALIGGACTALSVALAVLLAPRFSRGNAYLNGVYRYAIGFPNTGGVATPLILTFFGTAGLFKSGMLLFVHGIVCYTWGIMQLQPEHGRHNFGYYLRHMFNANFVAMLAGMALGLCNAVKWVPAVVLSIIDELGGCYVTLALLMTGFSIADYPIQEVVGDKRVYAYSFLRLLAIPSLYLLLMFVLKAPALLALFVVLFYACPCGMNAVVFPAAYGEDCRPGASMVLTSSLLSILTIPVMYALVTLTFGAI